MQETVKKDIETFLEKTLFSTMIPVLNTMFILIFILNINKFLSIILSITVVYFLDINICKYYINNKNKNKAIWIKNILVILILLYIVVFTTNKEISFMKAIINIFIMLIETQILLNVSYIEK